MKIARDKLRSVLQFYLKDMELEDKIFDALSDEDEE